MDLSYNEKLLLALYLELFNKPYDINSNMVYGIYGTNYNMLVRHVKMQNVCYLFQNLGINIENFSFSQNQYSPYSPGLEALLMDIDKKEDNIINFYEEYNKKRNKDHNNYKNQLQALLHDYLDKQQIDTVTKACYLLEDITSVSMGSEALCSMAYLYNSVYPKTDYEEINRRMIARNIFIDDKLSYQMWKSLKILGIVEIKPKTLKPEEKTYQKKQ